MSPMYNPSAALAHLPPWLWGNDVLGYASGAQLQVRPKDAATHLWRIHTLERYERRTPHLVRLIEIAAPNGPANFDRLERLPAMPVEVPVAPQILAPARHQPVASDADLLARFNWLHMTPALTSDADFIAAARSGFQDLRELARPDSGAFFPNAAAYFMRFDSAVNWRTGLARVLLRIEEEPSLLTNRPQAQADRLVFGTATSLMPDLALSRGAYLAPLFLCHSPWVWAIAGPRLQGVMIYSLGAPVRGRDPNSTEVLQQFMPGGPTGFPACPPFDGTHIATALGWWADQLNALFARVSDPATYADQNGMYQPRRHLECMLSLEQAGRSIQSILAHQRDQPTRLMLAFTALDTLEGLGLLAFNEAVELRRAQKALDSLEQLLPATVAELLLPTARRAVAALRECQDEFIPSIYVSNTQVMVPHKNGSTQTLTREAAMAQYLRVLRNAHHGFSNQDNGNRRRSEVLLLSHTGDLPSDLVLLPYLYWLQILAEPQKLKLAPRR